MTTSGILKYMPLKMGWHFVYIFLPFPGRFLPLFPAGVFITAGPIPKTIFSAHLDEITRKHHCTKSIVDDK